MDNDQPQINSLQTNPPPNNPQGWYKATVLRRFVASLVDGLILVPIIILVAFFYKPVGTNIILNLIVWGYGVFFIWRFGATLGKKLLKIQVVTTKYEPVGLWKAFLRELIGKFLSSLFFGLGYVWALLDKNRQTWHDKIAGTFVVTKIPNDGKNSKGMFIFIVILLSFVAISVLAKVGVQAINPLELMKRSRDAGRLSDLAILQGKINNTLISNPGVSLCKGGSVPCEGRSNLDGSGWLKINLTSSRDSEEKILPLDPLNSGNYFYRYCSDGKNWEIDARLESIQYIEKKQSSGLTDSTGLYKIGSDLNVCSNP